MEQTQSPKVFVAMKAFIIHQGKVLLLQEATTYNDGTQIGKYGEVGGRLLPGEHWKESLLREIKEESGLDVIIGFPFCVSEWRPIVRGEQWQIVATFFECFSESDQITLSEEHQNYAWINPEEYKNYPLMEDLYPVFEQYLTFKKA